VTFHRPTDDDVPFDHETLIELGASPSTSVITKCHSLLSQLWPLMVAPWNEPSA
jgi:hypothetical protein